MCWLVLAMALVLASDAAAERRSEGCARERLETGSPLRGEIQVDGVKRQFLLDVPDTIHAGEPVPLLLDFHGFGHSAKGVYEVSKFRDFAAAARFITVYPQGLNVFLLGRQAPGWEIFRTSNNRDLAFTRELISTLEREYCIDSARIYATGFSNGAFFSHLLACSMADRVAAIAAVGGGTLSLPCAPTRSVPVLIHHGRADEIVSVERARKLRDQWVALNGCSAQTKGHCERFEQCRDGAVVVYCEGDQKHVWPYEATEAIWKFLSDFRL